MITGTSSQGMRYAVRRGGSAVGYCALSIRCGTRDEGAFPSGIAHFTEHTLFKGTVRRRASAINARLDRLGGELNAYTTKEEIVLHATVLQEDLGKAVSLLLELATQATFPDAQVETERGVVIDEIISYKDSPAESAYDRFEERLFAGHPLERPILGTPASVRKITPEQLRRFVASHFTPDRMALTLVANLEETVMEKKLLKLTDACFGTFRPETPAAAEPVYPTALPFRQVVDKRHHEVNAVIGGTAPSLYGGKDRYTAVLLANILGGPASNSILNASLRERHGWVYGVECNYTPYADTGIIAVSFGCEKPNLERCQTLIARELAALREIPFSERKLNAAKKQLLGQLAISSESGEAQCLSMGKSLLSYGRVASSEENRSLIASVTAGELQEMARRLFSPDHLSSLIYR